MLRSLFLNALPSPTFQSYGLYDSNEASLFLHREPSESFLELWSLLEPKFVLHDKPGQTIIDFENSISRSENFWRFDLLSEDEQLEFLHWATIGLHEHVHAFDFWSSEFGHQLQYNRIMDAHAFCRILDVVDPRNDLPLHSKALNHRDNRVRKFGNERTRSEQLLGVLLGGKVTIGEIVEQSSQSLLARFVPASIPNFTIPLPAINPRFLGVDAGLIPFTTRHILEARAFIAQVAFMSRWFGDKYGTLYWRELSRRTLKGEGGLDYLAAILVVNSFFGMDALPTRELLFTLFDLCLQVRPDSDKSFYSIHPPTVLLHILSKLTLAGKNRPDLKAGELEAFVAEHTVLGKANNLLRATRQTIASRHDSRRHGFLDEIAYAFDGLRAEYLDFRLSRNTHFSPGEFVDDFLNGRLPTVPIEIRRDESFFDLKLYFRRDSSSFLEWYFLQGLLGSVWHASGVSCPVKRRGVYCQIERDGCESPAVQTECIFTQLQRDLFRA